MPDSETAAAAQAAYDAHIPRCTKLAEEAADADTVAKAAHERRDAALRQAVDMGWSPRKLHRAGVPLSTPSIYRIIGTVAA